MKKPIESALVKSCLDLLRLRHVWAWRNNSGGTIIGKDFGGTPRMIRFGLKGSSDILGCLNDGRLLAVECKSATGRLRKEQRAFLDAVRERGGVALVVRDVRDLAKALDLEGV